MQGNGQKMPLYEGADGKLYFNFGQGLKVRMHGSDCDKSEDYELEIVGCHYIGNTEYYDVVRDGSPLPFAQSANRVKYLLSRYGVKLLACGKRQELPLLLEEVQAYFEYEEQKRIAAQSEASKLTEYIALTIAARELNFQIGKAQAFERNEEAAALEAQRAELERRAADELAAHGINPSDIAEPAQCKKCGGKGFINTQICDCVFPNVRKIKDFNASRRLRLAKLLRG